MLLRTLSSIVLIPFFLSLVIKGPASLFSVVMIALLGTALYELYVMFEQSQYQVLKKTGVISGVLGALSYLLALEGFIGPQLAWGMTFFAFSAMFVVCGFKFVQIKSPLITVALSYFGFFYVFALGGSAIALRYSPRGVAWLIFIILVAKVSDIGGYLIGKSLGRRKITPNISPKKTLEGYIGSLIFGLGAGVLLGYVIPVDGYTLMTIPESLFVAFAVNVLAQGGDLAESMIKRSCAIKDSGSMVPGIGGTLDLMDSLLFALPISYMLFVMK